LKFRTLTAEKREAQRRVSPRKKTTQWKQKRLGESSKMTDLKATPFAIKEKNKRRRRGGKKRCNTWEPGEGQVRRRKIPLVK